VEDHLQLVSLGSLILMGAAPEFAIPFTGGWVNPASVGFTTLWAAAILTLVTGWDYLRVGLKHMD
jgi:cardiolipin synthase